MSTPRLLRQLTRRTIHLSPSAIKPIPRLLLLPLQRLPGPAPAPPSKPTPLQTRHFSLTRPALKGLIPDAEEPAAPTPEAIDRAQAPTPLEDEEYHERAEAYLEEVVERIEELQEGREDIEVDYSAGVLNVVFPPAGTYVLNKQPPNKQIWLSSPITGPKRFDWVVAGEGMEEKEGGGVGDWVYLRDGSSLTSLLRKELGITVVGGAQM